MKKKRRLFLLFLMISFIFLMVEGAVYAFNIKGFGDIRYVKSNNNPETKNGNFTLGQLDLYTAEEISDRLDVLVELVVESDEQGEWVIDGERIEIGYLFSDALIVRAGRFHNLLGFWNLRYHHGAHLQTTIDRPEFLEFEDDAGILPVHTVGLWAKGKTNISPIVLNYGIMLGNGSKLKEEKDETGAIVNVVLDPQNVEDNNRNKSISFNLMVRSIRSIGNGVGIFGNISQVEGKDRDGNNVDIDQIIGGAYLFYTALPFEIMSEYYNIRGDSDFSSNAFYIQGGYNIGRVRPYMRYEKLTIDEGDPYFKALGTEDNKRIVGGVRYDFVFKSALKTEIRKIKDSDNFTEYALQWTFAF